MSSIEVIQSDAQQIGATVTPFGIEFPESVSLEQWTQLGRKLCHAANSFQWCVGDWAHYGQRKYGALKKFAEVNGLAYQTLRDLGWISGTFELSRRRDNVEWSKYKEIAALPSQQQDKWIERISGENIKREAIRREVRASKSTEDAHKADGPLLRFASKLCDDLTTWLSAQGATFWTVERKAIWKGKLKPIVELYQKL